MRPFQSELTETVETDAMDTSDGPNQDTYVQMAKLAGASYKNEDVPGWKKLGDPAIRPKNFDALGGDTNYLATMYENRRRYMNAHWLSPVLTRTMPRTYGGMFSFHQMASGVR